MTDLFNNKIVCGKCNQVMIAIKVQKNGFILRAVKCLKCGNRIFHPHDEEEYRNFVNLKKKEYNVKMRFVGNSYAVSIPREIVDFMKEQEKIMDEMVKLSFEELGRISLVFGCNNCSEKITIKNLDNNLKPAENNLKNNPDNIKNINFKTGEIN